MMSIARPRPGPVAGSIAPRDAELEEISERVSRAFPVRDPWAPRRPPTAPMPALPRIDRELDEIKRAVALVLSPGQGRSVDLANIIARLRRIEDVLAGLRANDQLNEAARDSRDQDLILVDGIVVFVCFALSVHPRDLRSKQRTKRIAQGRFAVMWAIRRLRGRSYFQIGKALGGFDHTSVLNGVRRAEQLRAADSDFKALTDALIDHFEAKSASEGEEAPCLLL